MNKLALAMLGAATLAFGSAANATVTVTPQPVGSTLSVTGPTVTGNSTTIGYSDANLMSFAEHILFNNSDIGSYTVSLTTSSPGVVFTSAILTGPGVPGGAMNALTMLTAVGAVNQFWALDPTTLGAGDFSLDILGTASGGSLGGSVTISAVPEPSTWAFMLFGFGAMGIAVRRGRKQRLTQLA